MNSNERLKEVRESARIKQFEVANALKISRSNYNHKENGKVPFTVNEFFSALDYIKSKAPEAVQKFFPAGYYHADTSLNNNYEKFKIYDHHAEEPETGYNPQNPYSQDPAIQDSIEWQHIKTIRKFKNKAIALAVNEKLVELEDIDQMAFIHLVADIDNKIKDIKNKAEKRAVNEGE